MKYLLTSALLALQGCALQTTSGFNEVPGFAPVTVPANDTPQFRLDQQACLSEVNKTWAHALQENAAVIQFRQCLVNKGYRLLS